MRTNHPNTSRDRAISPHIGAEPVPATGRRPGPARDRDLADLVFADPISYLSGLGISATLVETSGTGLPAAA